MRTSLKKPLYNMGFRIPSIKRATKTISKGIDVPKGYLAVYAGDNMRRFVIPISYLNQPLFQELLSQVEEEYGYDHPMGGLTIPCSEDEFLNIRHSKSFSLLFHSLHTQEKWVSSFPVIQKAALLAKQFQNP
ncbi:hypothetical protein Ahy_B03g067997 [Arachis hypogaea]|uniref:Auxin-induced protein n=1 Tax=Arachis hypogaea TaxID=3818 RepID=A0A445A8A9_ARAHY|nr:hypothetical protein Ahy_B03g067997 [Arachis hypogaea]